jgi:hypothetical protein
MLYPRLIDQLTAELARELPVFAPLLSVAPPATYRTKGMKIARQPHRYSGRTAMNAGETVFEPKPLDDPQSPLAFSMEGYQGQPPSPLISRYWSPGWNSVQALNKCQVTIGKEAASFLVAKSKALAKCWGTVNKAGSVEDFLAQLQTVKVVRCDEPALWVLGLTLSNWNVGISLALAAVAGLAARR